MNSEQETVFLEQEYGEAKQVKVMARKIAETFLFSLCVSLIWRGCVASAGEYKSK